jgi:hypothetical protein
MGFFNDALPRSDFLHIFRTCLDARRQRTFFDSIVTAVTFEHHLIAGEIWE